MAHVAALARGFVLRLHFGGDEAHGRGAQAFQFGGAPGACQLQGHGFVSSGFS
jgi:hypothetical protein